MTWTAAAVGALVILADVLYFRFFGDVISAAALGPRGRRVTLAATSAASPRPSDFWLVADLLVALR